MQLKLGSKLIIILSSAMCLAGLFSAVSGVRMISNLLLEEMFTMVRMDLNAAMAMHDQALRGVEKPVQALAAELSSASPRNARLEQARRDEGLDFLVRIAADCRPDGWAEPVPLCRAAATGSGAMASTVLLPLRDLERLAPGLGERAAIPLRESPQARETSLRALDAGLVLASVAPVRDAAGRARGYLFGGRLLNRDARFVDGIMDMLYRGLRQEGRDAGVVTLFQGDVRIATTLQIPSDGSAVGTRGTIQALSLPPTRSSQQVERVFAMGTWYISAHESLRDFQGRPIATLFVGVMENRYTDRHRHVILIFLGFVAFGMAAAILVGHWLAWRLVEPLRSLTAAARGLAEGDLSVRTRLPAGDEFGDLGAAFDRMAESIQGNELRVKREAERQIAASERLAMVGQLAAGIAHEINNPLGGILVYSHLLLEDTPENDPRRSNLQKIAQETARCRDIVRSLLDFARQGELQVEDADLHALIAQSLDLAATQKPFRDVRIVKRFAPELPRIRLDRGKIQQVLLNIIFNAAEAMEDKGGTIVVSTRPVRGGDAVQVRIRDTGCGMPPEVLQRVFEPFFTTKEVGKGVGLGLSVSFGIVEKHAGRLRIRSRRDRGTVVSILLPVRGET